MAGDGAVAGEIGEDFTKQVEGLVDGPDGGIGAEVAGPVFNHAAGDGDFGEGVLPMDFDVRITFIIFETDVVVGAMFFDERHLEEERFEFSFGSDDFDVGDFAAETFSFIGVDIFGEVGADTVAKVDGFADIEDTAVFVFVDIDTGTLGEVG